MTTITNEEHLDVGGGDYCLTTLEFGVLYYFTGICVGVRF
jgi:hypothetical protein